MLRQRNCKGLHVTTENIQKYNTTFKSSDHINKVQKINYQHTQHVDATVNGQVHQMSPLIGVWKEKL